MYDCQRGTVWSNSNLRGSRNIRHCDWQVQTSSHGLSHTLHTRSLRMILTAEATEVHHGGEADGGTEDLVICDFQSQFQPLANVCLQATAPSGKVIDSGALIVIGTSENSGVKSFGNITWQQPADFTIPPLQ